MLQTRLGSFYEACINILIGYWVAVFAQVAIFPLFDIHIPFTTNMWIGFWFTLVSLARQYIIRRWFNRRLHHAAIKIASLHPTCNHPAEACYDYHDSSVVCRKCNSVIEQYGKPIDPPHNLSM